MPATSEFLKELEFRIRSFSPKDEDNVLALLNLGLIMHNMGWWNRLRWYLRELKRIMRECNLPEEMRLGFKKSIHHYHLSLHLIGDMASLKALKHLKKLLEFKDEDPYFVHGALRLFYEYLGHAPLAYKHLLLSVRYSEPGRVVAWVGCRRAFFLMCGGRDPAEEGIDIDNCEGEELKGNVKELPEMTALVKAHILSYATLMGLKEAGEVADRIFRSVKMGMERNYDHITLRILRAFIPVLITLRMRSPARNLVRTAIFTAKTERSRYMYEWFKLYSMAIEGNVEGIERRIEAYARRKYVAHEILAREIAHRFGVSPQENHRIAQEKAERYGGLCYLRMANAVASFLHP